MAFLNSDVLAAARIVARQAVDTALTSIVSPTSLADPFSTAPSSTSVPPLPTSSSASPTTTETLPPNLVNSGPSGDNSNNSNGNQSSLLFFVALGFGVVFTNLWIIVGVKYCFRYNARNRALRNDDGDPIDMQNMPRPHRRRREKKLMPIDEVNEKFPMLKYKTWVASRARNGLPTQGGVSAPSSRPNSIREAEGVLSETLSKERTSTDDRPTTSATATRAAENSEDSTPSTAEKPAVRSPTHVPKESTSSTVAGLHRASTESNRDPDGQKQSSHDDDHDEDERIEPPLPPECLGTSGDTCAICIDTLEDDDDVRGLTCGHAFHAVCIDPWLTTRRACCPLCKTDYYTPKPRPPPPPEAEGASGGGSTDPFSMANSTLPDDHAPSSRTRRHVLSPFLSSDRTSWNQSDSGRQGRSSRNRDGRSGRSDRHRHRNPPPAPPAPPAPVATGEAPASASRGVLSGIRNVFRRGRNQDGDAQNGAAESGANPTATPSQLEAGVRGSQR